MFHLATENEASPIGHPGSVNSSPRASKRISHSYYVVAIDYGKRGIEAVVKTEMTRRGAVAKVQEVIGDGLEIAFIHHIDGGYAFDCTEELMHDAGGALEAAE